MGNDGFHFEGFNFSDAAIIFLRIRDCEGLTCRGSGLYLKNCSASYVIGGYWNNNGGYGVQAETCGQVRLLALAFEKNQNLQKSPSSNTFSVQLRLTSCHGFSVLGCHFEDFANSYSGTALKTCICVENCNGGIIQGGTISNPASPPAPGNAGSRGIFVGSLSRGIGIAAIEWANVDTLININHFSDTNTGCMIWPQSQPTIDSTTAGQIDIPSGNGNVAFPSTTRTSGIGAGVVVPQIDGTTRDSLPSDFLQGGLLIYNSSTGKLNFFDGSSWKIVSS